MRSMTGYGRGEGDNGALRIVVEVKAVNHRYSEITIKQPRQLLALEDKMKKVISGYIERGKVDVFVRTQEMTEAAKPVQVDQQRALAYHQAMAQLAALIPGAVYKPGSLSAGDAAGCYLQGRGRIGYAGNLAVDGAGIAAGNGAAYCHAGAGRRPYSAKYDRKNCRIENADRPNRNPQSVVVG